MPRLPRALTVYPDYPIHKVWRGHNRESNLKTAEEKQRYLHLFMEEHKRADNPLQALCLMSNHAHEVIHVNDVVRLSQQMRRHHGRYGQFFNRLHKRCGKVAQDRPKTSLIGDDHHAMMVTFYVHANPVRAKMCKNASAYRWSTHRYYAYGLKPKWLTYIELPNWYLALGENPKERQRRYRQLFNNYLRHSGLKQEPNFSKAFIGPEVWQRPLRQHVAAWKKCHDPPQAVP